MKMKLKKGEKDEVLDKFDQEVNEVAAHSDLIRSLGCKDLQNRHWATIFKKMESNQSPMDRRDLNLRRMIDDRAEDHQETIMEIAGLAKGEAELIRQMDEVKGRWEVREFTVIQYRDTKDRYIISEVEDVITELEDDIMAVQAILSSRYITEIKKDIGVEEWETKLGQISDTIDEWLTFMRQWMYLENIFNAEDI